MARHLMTFFAGLAVNYDELAVAAVIERGKNGTKRLHVHFAMRGGCDFLEMKYLWGHGHVFFGDPNRYPGRSSPQRLAGYMAKYLMKDAGELEEETEDWQPGDHRWLHTQGFTPAQTTRRFERPEQAEGWLLLLMGPPARRFSFGQEKVDWAFGRWHGYTDEQCWPGPSPPDA